MEKTSAEGIIKSPLKAKQTKQSIVKSIEETTQEMVVIAILKEAIAKYLSIDDIYGYEEENTSSYYCVILGRLELSLMKRKQALADDQEALTELDDEK